MAGQAQALRAALLQQQKKLKEVEAHNTKLDEDKRRLQHELGVLQGDALRNATDLDVARAEQQTLLRSKKLAKEAAEQEVARLQRTTNDLLADKATLQNKIRSLEEEKCQLCAQVDTMRRDAETSCTLRHCLEAKHSGVVTRAEKAEADLAGLQQSNVELNMQMIKTQAEAAQLREDSQVLQAQKESVDRDLGHRTAALESMTKRSTEQAAKLSSAEARVLDLEEDVSASHAQLARQSSQLSSSEQTITGLQRELDELNRVHLAAQERHQAIHDQLQSDVSEQAESSRVQLRDVHERLAHSRAECQALREQLGIAARAKADVEANAQMSLDAAVRSETKANRERLAECEHLLRERKETLQRMRRELQQAQDQRSTLESNVGQLISINEDLHSSVQSAALACPGTKAAGKPSLPLQPAGKLAARRREDAAPGSPMRCEACYARSQPASPRRECGEASAVATSVKVRNQKALKRHISRSQQPRHAPQQAPSEHSIASRLGRAAASPLIKSAERLCRQQLEAEQRCGAMVATLEKDYLELYDTYQDLVREFKSAHVVPKRKQHVQHQLVSVMSELNVKSKQLISLKSTL